MKELLNQLIQYKTLTQPEAKDILTKIVSGKSNETRIAVIKFKIHS